ncbi:MAG: protein-ADP-ribose hydrolase, partial [Olsenella profusa]
ITCLAADAIVNAANTQMLGCWVPGHHCIDNAIHTYAGVQLRLACAELMQRQGHDEPTGHAKVTPAFNLPARYVLHTVGPIYAGRPSPRQDQQLADCYRSCLDAAEELGLTSVAFCCISTGVFGFPQERAARIAVDTVRSWLNAQDSDMTVVFNTFLDTDTAIYQRILGLGSSDDVAS